MTACASVILEVLVDNFFSPQHLTQNKTENPIRANKSVSKKLTDKARKRENARRIQHTVSVFECNATQYVRFLGMFYSQSL